METGTVKFFKTNEYGGFGFVTLPSGEELYFQRNDGGPVEAGKDEPSIQTWKQVREPRQGDLINFERSRNRKGSMAAPWCYHEEWNLALVEIAKRPTYRLMEQKGHRVRGNQKPQRVWQGTYLPVLLRMFPEGIPLTTQYSGDHWFVFWFEQQTEDGEWQRIDGDPRRTAPKDPDVKKEPRKLAWSYHNGHTATCPNCKEATVPARNRQNAMIFRTSKCVKCGETFEFVIPEDPDRRATFEAREMTETSYRDTMNEVDRYLRDHPDVIRG